MTGKSDQLFRGNDQCNRTQSAWSGRRAHELDDDRGVLKATIDARVTRQKITFTLRALLDNAIKFTPKGGSVAVTGQVHEHTVRIRIADTGIGISREELPKVFEKFYQVDPSHTGQIRGFGMGLFYARQFLQDHGGNVVLESTLGSGTVATLILPYR